MKTATHEYITSICLEGKIDALRHELQAGYGQLEGSNNVLNIIASNAAADNDADILFCILHHATPFTPHERLLSDASREGHIDLVYRMLTDPLCKAHQFEQHINFAFEMACAFGSLPMVYAMLHDERFEAYRPDLLGTHHNGAPLSMAVYRNQEKIVKLLLKEGTMDKLNNPSLFFHDCLVHVMQEGTLGHLQIWMEMLDQFPIHPCDHEVIRAMMYEYFEDRDLGGAFDAMRPFVHMPSVYTYMASYPHVLEKALAQYPEDKHMIVEAVKNHGTVVEPSTPLLNHAVHFEPLRDAASLSKNKDVPKKI